MSAGKLAARDFSLHPSLICSILLFSAYCIALVIVFMLPMVTWAKSVLILLLIISLVYYWCRDAWLILPASYLAIRLDGEDIVLKSRGGSEIPARVSRDSLVTPLLTILNISPADKQSRHAVVIFPDSMDKESFRELRVLMKWHGNVVSQVGKQHSGM